jgi:DNA-binding GntR family transcriptional regulator
MGQFTRRRPARFAPRAPARDNTSTTKIARPKSLTELVVEELRGRIIDGRLRLGEALSENTLAAELGISKTPVREALLQLKSERLVEVLPQRGTYVFSVAADQVAMIGELREILEVAAIAAAVERNQVELATRLEPIVDAMQSAEDSGDSAAYSTLDGEFHQVIIDLCGNRYIKDAFNQIGFRIQALRLRLSRDAGLNRTSLEDHHEMVRLAKARDVKALRQLMRRHIDRTTQAYLKVLERREGLLDVFAS